MAYYNTQKIWSRSLAIYFQWKAAKDAKEMEAQAKIDIARLKAKEKAA